MLNFVFLFSGANCQKTLTAMLGGEIKLESADNNLQNHDIVIWHENEILFQVISGSIRKEKKIDNRITLTVSGQKVTLSVKKVRKSDAGSYRFEILPKEKKDLEYIIEVVQTTGKQIVLIATLSFF